LHIQHDRQIEMSVRIVGIKPQHRFELCHRGVEIV
jgi:hypothetical protein